MTAAMTASQAIIRPAKPADAAAITACVTAAYERYIVRIGKRPGPMLADYAGHIARHRVFVLELQGEIAGTLVMIDQPGGVLLDNVAVVPACQGQGLGRRLIDYAEQTASRLGYPVIELYTHEKMTESHALYRRLGYREFDRRIESGYARIYMRKSLPGAGS